jgi:hypothetical protein
MNFAMAPPLVDPLVISHMGISQIGWIWENGFIDTITPKDALCNDPVSWQVIISLGKVDRHVVMAELSKDATLIVRYADGLKRLVSVSQNRSYISLHKNREMRNKGNHFNGGRESKSGPSISQVKCKMLQAKKEAAPKEAASS